MKILNSIFLILFSNLCFALGWDELSKEAANARDIDVSVVFDDIKKCHEIKAKLPTRLTFEELGERELWSVRYRSIKEKDQGWQLIVKGTEITLPANSKSKPETSVLICLDETDLKHGYLSALYGGPQGNPPMVVLLKLSDFI
ncbi:hypothetical protein MO867_13695 [Microbulbifer sp. OS29]|uniref:Uncharacterized protein n=1 Tax=Microbulbifer okhotskensis TaxID=2926617 RepID=A0A9X2J8C0_9GAMM|nr:hypothetical protein [Microbulbifer okhotskensis]MCO1335386.1 hypothetical protein [Microbulbifer okhotskensis]